MRRLVVIALALLLGSSCVVVRRARSYPEAEITTVEWYRPLESVPGRPAPPLQKTTDVPSDALEAMRAWAEARETTALVVLHEGELAYEWYAPGHSATSTTNAMSMTKTLIGLLVGAAIADGSIGSVDDAIGGYVPELARDRRGEITIRELLEMRSGLRRDERLKLGSDLVSLYLGPRIEESLLQIPSERLPGYAYDYNNANTQLLALVLERATGRRLAEYLSDRLWRPIGAGNASVWLDRPNGTAHAFCCVFATARDWARVGQLMLDDGRVGVTTVIPAEHVRRMTLPSPLNPDYGWHVWRAENGPGSTRAEDRSEPFLDDSIFWLDGRGTQRVYVVPRERLVIVRVGEEPPDWDEAMLPNTLVRALREPAR